jgi:hypothetical protein
MYPSTFALVNSQICYIGSNSFSSLSLHSKYFALISSERNIQVVQCQWDHNQLEDEAKPPVAVIYVIVHGSAYCLYHILLGNL